MHTNMLEVKLICYDLMVLVVIVFFSAKRTCGPSEEGMIHCPFFSLVKMTLQLLSITAPTSDASKILLSASRKSKVTIN
jgi:hypothetical protein